MPVTYRLLGISGSIRTNAHSKAILATLAETAASNTRFDYVDIGQIPHFNQDLYVDPLPEVVVSFRNQIEAADGLVISSPEYNHGMPGVLKNAFDWASRPHNGSPLRNKPVLIITSSPAFTGGVRAQYQIRETLVSALARPVSTPEIVIGNVGGKIAAGCLTDEPAVAFGMAGLAMMFEDIEMLWRR